MPLVGSMSYALFTLDWYLLYLLFAFWEWGVVLFYVWGKMKGERQDNHMALMSLLLLWWSPSRCVLFVAGLLVSGQVFWGMSTSSAWLQANFSADNMWSWSFCGNAWERPLRQVLSSVFMFHYFHDIIRQFLLYVMS